MAQAGTRAPTRAETRGTSSPWARGVSVFAASMMVVVGFLQFFEGLIALVNGNDLLLRTPNYVFQFDASVWGWTHMIIGILLAAAGAFIFSGNPVARGVGVFVAGLSAILNFLWLPYYPFWALTVLALDVFVIWGLASSRLDEA
jgi:hypothetical protein